jgi:serine/threonine-protein kinase
MESTTMAFPARREQPDGVAGKKPRRDQRPLRDLTPLPVPGPARERQLLEGTLAGRFKIRRLIGRGGMSSVYLAWDHALERKVAIKVLAPEFETEVEDRERFRREARIAADLFHPNIVPVYASEQRNGLTFVVMHYVAGPSLAARLESAGALTVQESVEILVGLSRALDAVHRIGVVHRDIKPDNVLLDEISGRPLLTDFGVATVSTSEHSRSEVAKALGTPHYMSPEQALGEQAADGRSDLYSLGVMGFRMLAGRLPFKGGSAQSVVAQHVALEPPPVRHYAPHVPEGVARVLERCLAKNPAKRWQDATQFRTALLKAAQSSGSRWHPRALLQHLRKR